MSESNWFTFKADIEFGAPYFNEETKEFSGGQLVTKALSQEMLEKLVATDGHFLFCVDACTDELWLRVRRSDAETEETEHDLVFMNISLRNAERIRDALDAALKLMQPKSGLDSV